MEEKIISEKESLQLIRQMIHTAKKEQKDDGMGWILWGWLLLGASLLTVGNIRFNWFDELFLFWNIFGAITLLFFIWQVIAGRRARIKVKTYTGDLFKKLNAGFFISLLFIIVAINVGSQHVFEKLDYFDGIFVRIGFALLISLYAFWILIYGAALNFRPSIIAAYASWGIGFSAMFVKTFEHTMWLHALAVLVGYIIPGYIANREFKKTGRKEKAVESV